MTIRFEVDMDELAVRIIEAATEAPRPRGWTNKAILNAADHTMASFAMRAAQASVQYHSQCIVKQERLTVSGLPIIQPKADTPIINLSAPTKKETMQ